MLLAWLYLAAAISLEVTATLSLRSAGNGNLPALAVVVVGYVSSFALLFLVLRKLDVSVAYAVWSGAGTAVVAFIGIVALGESSSPAKIASLALIIVGVVGLNLSGAH
ncbi:Nicotine metabolites export pump subunit NepB [Paraconexibacter sp. AEG42_29]|uniref:Nicotine metabolites export pump subunit NepB n=1 Tax=Paraconexibacter sp. AEG42_29 TaxID=2997339 RepID=A0AAU7B3A2_9ACTN